MRPRRRPPRPAPCALVLCLFAAACGPGEVPAGPAATEPGAEPPRARGVVLYVVDTLRADRFTVDGYERATSPAFDALAARGTRWTRNYTQGSWTVPGMLSMLTGLYLVEESHGMPRGTPTLAELVSEAGVETAAFLGNPVLSGSRGFHRGFDHVETPGKGPEANGRNTRARVWVERFERWHAERADAERPFFAWIHVLDPHDPYTPSRRFDRFQGAPTAFERDVLEPRWRAAADEVARYNESLEGAWTTDEAVANLLADRAAYDGEVLEADLALERLLAFLDAHEDVLLVVASDHGEMLYETPRYRDSIENVRSVRGGLPKGLFNYFAVRHTGYLYEEVFRTPLLMAGPGVAAGAVVEGLSENLDVAPTVLDALGVAYDGPLQGHSKLRPAPGREAVFGHGLDTTAVVTHDGLHLIDLPPGRLVPGATARGVQLLRAGPTPLARDLVEERPDALADLLARIEAWRAGGLFESTAESVSDEDRAILAELGYLDPDAVGEPAAGTRPGGDDGPDDQ